MAIEAVSKLFLPLYYIKLLFQLSISIVSIIYETYPTQFYLPSCPEMKKKARALEIDILKYKKKLKENKIGK